APAMNAAPGPLVVEIDYLDPALALDALSHLPYPFLLHSASQAKYADWSFFGASPFQVFRGAPLDELSAQWSTLATVTKASRQIAPFMGGAVGYWSYDLGRRFERLPERARDDLRLPDYVVGFYDVVGAIDHRKRRALLFGSHLSLGGEGRVKRLADRLDLFRRLIDARRGKTPRTPEVPVSVMRDRHRIDATSLRCTLSDERYLSAVAQVKEHIVAGDIFQANLSRRWSL